MITQEPVMSDSSLSSRPHRARAVRDRVRARHRHSAGCWLRPSQLVVRHGVMGVSLAGYSMPIFWWGLLLILPSRLQLGWTPVSAASGQVLPRPVTGFLRSTRSSPARRAVPVGGVAPDPAMIVLGTNPLAIIARMTRSAMLEVLGEDTSARPGRKGLSQRPRHSAARVPQRADSGHHVIGLQVGVCTPADS